MPHNFGIYCNSDQYPEGKSIKVNQSWRAETNEHKSDENDHNYDHPKVLPESFMQVRAVHKYAAQKDTKVATKHATKTKIPSFQRHNRKALSSHSTKQSPQNGRFPALPSTSCQFLHSAELTISRGVPRVSTMTDPTSIKTGKRKSTSLPSSSSHWMPLSVMLWSGPLNTISQETFLSWPQLS